jgi:Gly-Xaa carboxypeptidase
VDIISGGVKINALPEQVFAMVNFRIDFASNLKDTRAHIAETIKKVAKKHDMVYDAFSSGNRTSPLGKRFIKIEQLGEALEPAPRSPQEGGVWDLFAGTIK